MLRRALVLALALVTMTAPLALVACQWLCAGHDATHSGAGAPVAHSCHGDEPTAAVTVTALPHVCGHADDAPAGAEAWVQSLAAPVAVPAEVALFVPPIPVNVAARAAAADTSPPGAFARLSQLRV